MVEYKDTLNLPHTAFPMKASLAQREPKMLLDWEQQGVYQKMREARADAPRFILHDGPPYANGHLHCGHALNKILKDIIIKSKAISGFDAPYVPGWDCHGLPIELNVEKKVGKAGVKIGVADFRVKCREYAQTQIDIQREEFKRLGVLGDWDKRYATMDYTYEANIVRALGKIIDNGHLQQGFKPVHWCFDCGSALAEAEVEYEDKESHSIDIAFVARKPKDFLDAMKRDLPIQPLIVPVWTTTPWTLPANEAVCLHPDVAYALVDCSGTYYLLANDLVESVMARYGIDDYEVKATAVGMFFEKLVLQHPIYDKDSLVIVGEHVTTDSGTGCVHTAPAHGPDDYVIAQNYNLPLANPVLGNGCFAEDVALFAGQHVRKANAIILDAMRDKKTLLYSETILHSYPHCWRHKSPVIFRATPQWFIGMDKNGLREQILEQLDKVQWIPTWGEARIRKMVEDRPDWCISRQRAWGTPMPLFVHQTTRALHSRTVEMIEDVALLIEKEGIEAWFNLDPETLLGEDAQTYDKITDTLDVWFDSGVTHFCVLKQREALGLPADLYLEGSDQHRGWFNSSLTTAVAIDGTPPYRTVLTHGYTVDADGRKLSKSKGNYVALDKLVKQHGADILRLWVSSTDYRNEVSISDEIIKRTGDAYRRIRNTSRFLLANLFDFEEAQHTVAVQDMVELDKWAIKRCHEVQEEIKEAYESYQFHVVYQKINHFCTMDMGSFYLDIIKDRQYTTPANSNARRSCQTAIYIIVQALTRWLAPILSFTAEEIWQAIPGQNKQESIFLQEWFNAWPALGEVDMAHWEAIQAVRHDVNKALEVKRKEGVIGSGLAADVVLYCDDKTNQLLEKLGDELRFVLITSSASLAVMEKCTKHALLNEAGNMAVEACASTNDKCTRCWHRRADIGENAEHPELCTRCVGNISGQDELREFA